MPQSEKPNFLRQQLLIDDHVQCSLLRRTALYSAACGVYFLVILIFTQSMSHPNVGLPEAILQCLDEAIYWAPGLILLAPLVAYDMLKLTNRFAGPVFRLRREMQRLVDGESEFRLSFREGDYWVEMADVFNELRDELLELRAMKDDYELRLPSPGAATPRAALFDRNGSLEADDFLTANG